MPAYNVERYIGEAIESILCQSFRDFELIIVDDCSNDSTLNIIKTYAMRDPRIVYRSNSRRMRISASLNAGVALARGTYIARMDADDIALPERFKKQVGFLESHPEVGIVGGTMLIVNEHNVPIGERRYWTDDATIRKHIFRYSPFCHPSIMVRKSVLERAGLYGEHSRVIEDYELYFRIGMVTRFANLHEPILRYRVRPRSLTNDRQRQVEFSTIETRKKYFREYEATFVDRIYNALHFLSMYSVPSKWKYWIFLKIREKIL